MAWLEDVINEAQAYAHPKDDPGYIWDNILGVCAPFTVLDAIYGNLGLGMTDYEVR